MKRLFFIRCVMLFVFCCGPTQCSATLLVLPYLSTHLCPFLPAPVHTSLSTPFVFSPTSVITLPLTPLLPPCQSHPCLPSPLPDSFTPPLHFMQVDAVRGRLAAAESALAVATRREAELKAEVWPKENLAALCCLPPHLITYASPKGSITNDVL